jgi:hypothetical protein
MRWMSVGLMGGILSPRAGRLHRAVRCLAVRPPTGCVRAAAPCPLYSGKRYEDWEFDDPADADLDGVRRIRDETAERVRRLLAELTG